MRSYEYPATGGSEGENNNLKCKIAEQNSKLYLARFIFVSNFES